MDLQIPPYELKQDEETRAETLKRRQLLQAAARALFALEEHCSSENGYHAENIRIVNAQEELELAFGEDFAGICEECGLQLLRGEQGHVCHDGDPIFCADHAYTWAQVKESYECGGGLRDSEPEAYAEFVARFEAHTAGGGSPDDKMLHTL